MVRLNENIVGIDSAIFMHPKIWQASGHVGAFNDPLIDNKDSKKRYRADVLIEDYIAKLEEKIAKDVEKARLPLENDTVWLRIDYCFTPSEGDLTEPDTATVYTSYDGQDWQPYDYSLKMRFTLDYFTGYRTGLYCYSTGGDGGYADFDFFRQSVTD